MDDNVSERQLTAAPELLDSGFMSDCVIKCGDQTWACHKLILCVNSKFFRDRLMCGHLNHLDYIFDFDYAEGSNFCYMLDSAVALYVYAQSMDLDEMCQHITSISLLFNQKHANWVQRRWQMSGKDAMSGGFEAHSADRDAREFIRCAKTAYAIRQDGPNSVRETSIRTPFRDFVAFNRFAILGNPTVLADIRDELPEFLTDIMSDIAKRGLTAGLEVTATAGSVCRQCRENPLAGSNHTNFWMNADFCNDCGGSGQVLTESMSGLENGPPWDG